MGVGRSVSGEGVAMLRVPDWNEFGMCDQEHAIVVKPWRIIVSLPG